MKTKLYIAQITDEAMNRVESWDDINYAEDCEIVSVITTDNEEDSLLDINFDSDSQQVLYDDFGIPYADDVQYIED